MGMAGSGKTTLLQRLNIYTAEKGIKSYFINLDPAVKKVQNLNLGTKLQTNQPIYCVYVHARIIVVIFASFCIAAYT